MVTGIDFQILFICQRLAEEFFCRLMGLLDDCLGNPMVPDIEKPYLLSSFADLLNCRMDFTTVIDVKTFEVYDWNLFEINHF